MSMNFGPRIRNLANEGPEQDQQMDDHSDSSRKSQPVRSKRQEAKQTADAYMKKGQLGLALEQYLYA